MNIPNRKKTIYSLLILFSLSFTPDWANAQQHYLKIGTQFPLQHSIGYEYQSPKNLTFGLGLGLFTKPYDKVALGVMREWGMSQELKVVLEESFKYGWLVQPELGYKLKNNWQVSLFGQRIRLIAEDPTPESVAAYFGTSVFELDDTQQQILTDLVESGASLDIRGTLLQVGFQVGKVFQLKNPRWSVLVSGGLSSNIRSQSKIEIELKNASGAFVDDLVEQVEEQVNQELQDTYLKYAHIPVLSVQFRYLLGKEQ